MLTLDSVFSRKSRVALPGPIAFSPLDFSYFNFFYIKSKDTFRLSNSPFFFFSIGVNFLVEFTKYSPSLGGTALSLLILSISSMAVSRAFCLLPDTPVPIIYFLCSLLSLRVFSNMLLILFPHCAASRFFHASGKDS